MKLKSTWCYFCTSRKTHFFFFFSMVWFFRELYAWYVDQKKKCSYWQKIEKCFWLCDYFQQISIEKNRILCFRPQQIATYTRNQFDMYSFVSQSWCAFWQKNDMLLKWSIVKSTSEPKTTKKSISSQGHIAFMWF